jgi:serine phosphatase RsbU (regulator of sigma subunit)
MSSTAVVVVEPPASTDDLDRGLTECGFTVVHASPAELASTPSLVDSADVVLASASLGLNRVALLAQRLAGADRPPVVLIFPQDDYEMLEACARGGFDYVTPPFRAGLLRGRMAPAMERRQLVGAVGELATEVNLRAYERDLSIAHEIQAGFLPEHLPEPLGWQVASRFRPAREVAGDFYDGFELVGGNRLGFVVADVCDKGVSAALFMALIRTLLRHTAEQTGSWNVGTGGMPGIVPAGADSAESGGAPAVPVPPRLSVGAGPLVQSVMSTNRYLTSNHLRQGYFVTLVFAVLDPLSGALLYINGGHNPPVLVRKNGEQLLLHRTGPALGMLQDSVYSLGYVILQPGDTLILYTDGVVEALSPDGELFGTDRLQSVLAANASSADAVLSAVDDTLAEHVGNAAQSDDITMLALRRTG